MAGLFICWRRVLIVDFNLCNSSSGLKVWFCEEWTGQSNEKIRRKCTRRLMIGELKSMSEKLLWLVSVAKFVGACPHLCCLLRTSTKQNFVFLDFGFDESSSIFIQHMQVWWGTIISPSPFSKAWNWKNDLFVHSIYLSLSSRPSPCITEIFIYEGLLAY